MGLAPPAAIEQEDIFCEGKKCRRLNQSLQSIKLFSATFSRFLNVLSAIRWPNGWPGQANWIQKQPGSRPHCWWQFTAPRLEVAAGHNHLPVIEPCRILTDIRLTPNRRLPGAARIVTTGREAAARKGGFQARIDRGFILIAEKALKGSRPENKKWRPEGGLMHTL